MWCFIDESWHEGENEHVGTLAAAVGSKADFDELARFLFRVRKKYYGEENARDLRSERFGFFHNKIIKVQTVGKDHHEKQVFGFLRLQWLGDDNFTVRKNRTKKNKLGSSGKEEY